MDFSKKPMKSSPDNENNSNNTEQERLRIWLRDDGMIPVLESTDDHAWPLQIYRGKWQPVLLLADPEMATAGVTSVQLVRAGGGAGLLLPLVSDTGTARIENRWAERPLLQRAVLPIFCPEKGYALLPSWNSHGASKPHYIMTSLPLFPSSLLPS